jgi:hypothetical protein
MPLSRELKELQSALGASGHPRKERGGGSAWSSNTNITGNCLVNSHQLAVSVVLALLVAQQELRQPWMILQCIYKKIVHASWNSYCSVKNWKEGRKEV